MRVHCSPGWITPMRAPIPPRTVAPGARTVCACTAVDRIDAKIAHALVRNLLRNRKVDGMVHSWRELMPTVTATLAASGSAHHTSYRVDLGFLYAVSRLPRKG